jgi:hypothetical protein
VNPKINKRIKLGILPGSSLTGTKMARIQTCHMNQFMAVAGANLTISVWFENFYLSNEWIIKPKETSGPPDIHFALYFVNDFIHKLAIS